MAVTIFSEVRKLNLIWDEMFLKIPERTALYQKAEDVSPYGSGISFAQRADTYSQEYLKYSGNQKQVVVADIDALSETLLSIMLRYPINMQSLTALGQLAHARMLINNKSDPVSIREMYMSGRGIMKISPGNPKGYSMLAEAYAYDGKDKESEWVLEHRQDPEKN
jgi:hypothetical protein